MRFKRIISTLLATTALISTTTLAQAQRRPSGVASLAEMVCRTMSGGSDGRALYPINQDFAIGFEVFTAVAMLGSHPVTPTIDRDKPTQVACRLSSSSQNTQYRTLSLAFGIPDNNGFADPSEVTRLSIYLNGEFYRYQDVVKGEKYFLSIDVENVRSVGLEARCLSNNDRYCGAIYFFEDILER